MTIKDIFAYFKENSWRGLFINLVIIVLLGVGGVIFFFSVYLPSATNHRETITVPNLRGKSLEEVTAQLGDMELRGEVYDSSSTYYTPDYPPFTILSHSPEPGAKVKLNRKIYLTINPVMPPIVKVPNLVDGSVKNALIILNNYGLKLGERVFKDDLAKNAVLGILYNGEEITKEELEEGFEVPKGSQIDLLVGNGLGKSDVAVPNVVGMPFDEVEVLLIGMGLALGEVEYVESELATGTVVLQNPAPDDVKQLRIGNVVDVQVAGYFPENVIDATNNTDEEGKDEELEEEIEAMEEERVNDEDEQ